MQHQIYKVINTKPLLNKGFSLFWLFEIDLPTSPKDLVFFWLQLPSLFNCIEPPTTPLFENCSRPFEMKTKSSSPTQNKTIDAGCFVFKCVLKSRLQFSNLKNCCLWLFKNISHFCAVQLENKFNPDPNALHFNPKQIFLPKRESPLMQKPPKHF